MTRLFKFAGILQQTSIYQGFILFMLQMQMTFMPAARGFETANVFH
jgi:hypothetical protein